MTKAEYNGWTNYETWNVNLWIDNDQGCASYWAEHAQEAYNDADPGDNETREIESEPREDCECGFCATAKWGGSL